ncbi:MAG: hypothetical protein ACRDSN_19200, partial [Pseudonocardiaceae bacterium]
MPALSASELLLVWEQGRLEAPHERSLTMLASVDPTRQDGSLSELTVAERDAQLLALREDTFGSRIETVVDCPACDEALELALDTRELAGEAQDRDVHSIGVDGGKASFRLPTCGDVAGVAGEGDVAGAAAKLLERCVIDPPAAGLSDLDRAAVVDRMAELDPLAALELEVACPACGHVCSAGFDIASFLWKEVEAAARRTLEDVHALASAYGWCEA